MPNRKTLIDDLINALTCLPGVGKKTAQRMTYHLLQRAKDDALNLSDVLKEVVTSTVNCKLCRNLSQENICDLCSDDGRDNSMLCIVESPADVFNMENSTNYNVVHAKSCSEWLRKSHIILSLDVINAFL